MYTSRNKETMMAGLTRIISCAKDAIERSLTEYVQYIVYDDHAPKKIFRRKNKKLFVLNIKTYKGTVYAQVRITAKNKSAFRLMNGRGKYSIKGSDNENPRFKAVSDAFNASGLKCYYNKPNEHESEERQIELIMKHFGEFLEYSCPLVKVR